MTEAFLPLLVTASGEAISTHPTNVIQQPQQPQVEKAKRNIHIPILKATALMTLPPPSQGSMGTSTRAIKRIQYVSIADTMAKETPSFSLPVQALMYRPPSDFLRSALQDAITSGLTIVPSARHALFHSRNTAFFERCFWWMYLKYLATVDVTGVYEAYLAEEAARKDVNKNSTTTPAVNGSNPNPWRVPKGNNNSNNNGITNTSSNQKLPSHTPRHLHTSQGQQELSVAPKPPAIPRLSFRRRSSVPAEVSIVDLPVHYQAMCDCYFDLFQSIPFDMKDNAMRCYPEIMTNAIFRALRFCFPYLKDGLTPALYVSMFEDLTYLTTGVERSRGYVIPHEDTTSSSSTMKDRKKKASLSYGMSEGSMSLHRAQTFRTVNPEQQAFKRELEEIIRKPPPSDQTQQNSNTNVARDEAEEALLKVCQPQVQRIIKKMKDNYVPPPPTHWYESGKRCDELRNVVTARGDRGLFDVTQSSPFIRIGMTARNMNPPPHLESRGKFIRWTM